MNRIKVSSILLWGFSIFLSSVFAGDAKRGKKIFQDSGTRSNGLACLTCHTTPERGLDNILRPGHSMINVLGRPSYWGGLQDTFEDATSFCAKKYMQVEALSETDMADLRSYAETLGDETTLSLKLAKRSRRTVSAVTKLQGDIRRGKQISARACQSCHEKKGPGPLLEETLSPGQIIVVILSTGGKIMPFFSTDRLSDQDVADVAVYVASINRSSKVYKSPS